MILKILAGFLALLGGALMAAPIRLARAGDIPDITAIVMGFLGLIFFALGFILWGTAYGP